MDSALIFQQKSLENIILTFAAGGLIIRPDLGKSEFDPERHGGLYMEKLDSEVPLPRRLKTVAILFNLKKGLDTRTLDAEAEYDSIDTVHAIKNALEEGGLAVEPDRSRSLTARTPYVKPRGYRV